MRKLRCASAFKATAFTQTITSTTIISLVGHSHKKGRDSSAPPTVQPARQFSILRTHNKEFSLCLNHLLHQNTPFTTATALTGYSHKQIYAAAVCYLESRHGNKHNFCPRGTKRASIPKAITTIITTTITTTENTKNRHKQPCAGVVRCLERLSGNSFNQRQLC